MGIDDVQEIAHAYMLALPLNEQVHVLNTVLNVPVSTTPTGYYMHREALWGEDRMREFCINYIKWMRVTESELIYNFLSNRKNGSL